MTTDPGPTEPTSNPADSAGGDVGELFRRLTDDSRALLRYELDLAKLEISQSVSALARSSIFLVLGALLAGIGLIVLLVFAVIGLGALLDGEYWLSSLIVGAVLAIGGATLLLIGRRRLARAPLKPETMIRTVRDTAAWAGNQGRDFKRDLTR